MFVFLDGQFDKFSLGEFVYNPMSLDMIDKNVFQDWSAMFWEFY